MCSFEIEKEESKTRCGRTLLIEQLDARQPQASRSATVSTACLSYAEIGLGTRRFGTYSSTIRALPQNCCSRRAIPVPAACVSWPLRARQSLILLVPGMLAGCYTAAVGVTSSCRSLGSHVIPDWSSCICQLWASSDCYRSERSCEVSRQRMID